MSNVPNTPPTTRNKFGRAIRRPIRSMLTLFLMTKKLLWSRTHRCILIACMPKSGSTYLTKTIVKATGFKRTCLCEAFQRHEQNLDYSRLIETYGRKTVCQLHAKATETNLEFIQSCSIKPIVLVRNIFDVVVSVRDHLFNEDTKSPIAWINDEFFKLDEKSQMDFIIDIAVPWYIGFYVSWFAAEQEGFAKPIWVTYEQVTGESHATLTKLLEFMQVKKSSEEIENAIQEVGQKNVRFNKGVSGRGLTTLTENQIQRIKTLADHYPWVDFSRIGIPR